MVNRLQIKGQIYRAQDLDSIKLADTFAFDEQVFAYRHAGNQFPDVTWADVEEAMNEISALDQKEAGRHRRANLVLAATLWLTMRHAGKPMDMADVIELDMGKDIIWLPHTDDNEAGGASDPTKRPAPSRASAAGGSVPGPPALSA